MNLSFAMLGWSEIIAILLVLGIMAAGLVGVIVIAIMMTRKWPAKSPATSAPPALPAEPGRCPRCGTTLGSRVAQGLCPKCVLAAGFETQAATEPTDEPTRAPAAIPGTQELAGHFPQLEILELLGRGGMGWVYKARQKNLDRVVALKVLPPEVGKDPAFAERFQREARALARLNHPNIVAIYDFGQAGPYFYFVMEFVDGANLRQLERSRRLSPEEAFAIVPKICEALQFAHDEGIVHRDIKPENILVDGKGRVKIADFGIAKIVGHKEDLTLTGTQHTLGTPHYMAPEQLETPTKVDHRADIYALGVVFYEMLTGELPMGRFEPPSKHVQVDVRVDEVVLRSLERSPERRYQTVGAVKTDVETISNPTVTGPKPTEIPPQLSEPSHVPTPPDRNPGLLNLVRFAWQDWWSERAKWFAAAVQAVLVLLHIACLFAFIGTGIKTRGESGGHRQFTYTLGAWEPWFTFETYPTPNTPFRSGFDPIAGSMLFLIAGFAIYYVVWRIEKVRNPKVGFWSSPAAMGIFWAIFAVAAVGMGTKMGFDALKENSLGGLLSPQLRSALEIRDTGDRDEALRQVTLLAASAMDMKTVTRAILEIRDGDLHDQTAADAALALAKLMNGTSNAMTVANLIRLNSLRDATLARIVTASPTNGPPSAATLPSGGHQTPPEDLAAAAASGGIARISQLLDAGQSVNQPNARGETPLMAAVANGHRPLALTLLLLGADLTAQDTNGLNALMHAVQKGDRAFVGMLGRYFELSYTPDGARRRETLAALPGLERALLKGRDFDLVQFAAWHDALDQVNAQGDTASLMAARAGDWEAFQMLAHTERSVLGRSTDGTTAAIWFATNGTVEPFRRLEQALFGRSGGELGFVREMVAFDVDQLALRDQQGRTALQLAKDRGHAVIADILTRHLRQVIAQQTAQLERLESSAVPTAEQLALFTHSPQTWRDATPEQQQELVATITRWHRQNLRHARQALGEPVKEEVGEEVVERGPPA